jgi:ComF family protein
MAKPAHVLIDFLFPPHCLLCQRRGAFICPACKKSLVFLKRQVCPYCAKPSLTGQVHEACRRGYFLDGLVSAFSYHSPFKKIIAQIKFEPYLFSALEELTASALVYLDSDNRFLPFRNFISKENPVVIPIPLYKGRLRQRGFNQAQIIGKKIVDHYGLVLEEKLLLRGRSTGPQFKLDERERRQNIQGALLIDKVRLGNCLTSRLPSILLVDDIWTTGATMKEATRVLKKAGIPKIWGLTLAQ